MTSWTPPPATPRPPILWRCWWTPCPEFPGRTIPSTPRWNISFLFENISKIFKNISGSGVWILLWRPGWRRLLRWPRGWVPGLPHLHCWRSRRSVQILILIFTLNIKYYRSGQVQLPLSQRHPLQPELLHLRLVVQLRLRHSRGPLQPERRDRCREVNILLQSEIILGWNIWVHNLSRNWFRSSRYFLNLAPRSNVYKSIIKLIIQTAICYADLLITEILCNQFQSKMGV